MTFGIKTLTEYGLTEEQAKEIRNAHFEEVNKACKNTKWNQKLTAYQNVVISIVACLKTASGIKIVLDAAQKALSIERKEEDAEAKLKTLADPKQGKQNEDKNQL